ncbi:hypothetical protein ACINB_32790 [Acidovorax sp. NB1]|nr:hypothetical protein ACINB_32790 [Acidovorax sp. NB1]
MQGVSVKLGHGLGNAQQARVAHLQDGVDGHRMKNLCKSGRADARWRMGRMQHSVRAAIAQQGNLQARSQYAHGYHAS